MNIVKILVLAALVAVFGAALFAQRNTGLADNGDFLRGTALFSPGPVGFDSAWAQPTAQDFNRRFFTYWIPDWKEGWAVHKPASSVLLLWLPGLVVDHFITPAGIHLPTLGLFPRLLWLGFLIAVVLGIFSLKASVAARLLLLATAALPLLLLFTTADYTLYFNSFYQESASLVYLVFFAGSLVLLKLRPGRKTFWTSLALLALLVTAKRSNIYWPLVGLPCIAYARFGSAAFRSLKSLGLLAAGFAVFIGVAGIVTENGNQKGNAYHSLYYSVLTFSGEPSRHLARLGLDGTEHCIGVISHLPQGARCMEAAGDKLSFRNPLSVVLHEPMAGARTAAYTLNAMQDLSLEYLGTYALGDPRYRSESCVDGDPVLAYESRAFSGRSPWNAWSAFKFHAFPVGAFLAVVLGLFLGVFALRLKGTGLSGALALAGLALTIGCVLDMAVAVAGDGRYELVKHLALANLAFDLALIAFVNTVLIAVLRKSDVRGV